MKIALVTPYDWSYAGGVNRHIDDLAAEFKNSGHEVTIIAPASKKENSQGIMCTKITHAKLLQKESWPYTTLRVRSRGFE